MTYLPTDADLALLNNHSSNIYCRIDITADERKAWNAKPTQDELAAAKAEAISTAADDATTKADNALAAAKTYADGLNTTMDGRVQVLEGAITWKSLDG